MRTNELRKLIKSVITAAVDVETYYEVADDKAEYPYIVFDTDSINLGDIHRQDYRINIDVWDRGADATRVENILDSVEHAFCAVNMPQSHILPTFFIESRRTIEDQDKQIRHKLLEVVAQNYEV